MDEIFNSFRIIDYVCKKISSGSAVSRKVKLRFPILPLRSPCIIFAISISKFMSRFISTIILIFVSSFLNAQEINTEVGNSNKLTSLSDADSTTTMLPGTERPYTFGYSAPYAMSEEPTLAQDSLHLPVLDSHGRVAPFNLYPLYYGGWYSWELHPGLNVSAGASVFAQFGKNARHGAGFSQNLSAMYAIPVNNKLSIALGGYLNNIYWAHDAYRDAGLSAIIGYKFDEHWEVYLYGHKSLTDNRRMPYCLYNMSSAGDRIGAAVKYNFNESTSIQISVENVSMPKRNPLFLEPPVTPGSWLFP